MIDCQIKIHRARKERNAAALPTSLSGQPTFMSGNYYRTAEQYPLNGS
jgi:hypothetical protein